MQDCAGPLVADMWKNYHKNRMTNIIIRLPMCSLNIAFTWLNSTVGIYHFTVVHYCALLQFVSVIFVNLRTMVPILVIFCMFVVHNSTW